MELGPILFIKYVNEIRELKVDGKLVTLLMVLACSCYQIIRVEEVYLIPYKIIELNLQMLK